MPVFLEHARLLIIRLQGRPQALRVRQRRSLGQPIRVPDEVIHVHQRDRDQVALKDFGKADFEAWVRKLDTVDRGWRE